jgi:hypothetical protein
VHEEVHEWLEVKSMNTSFVWQSTCRKPSFGLATKAKGLQGCEPKKSPGVKSKGLTRVWAKKKSRESHHILPGV